jgi:phage-related protein
VIAMMLVGGVVLWVGIPLAWLWIGSQIQGATDSLGAAVAAMMFGVISSIALMIPVLGWLSRKYGEIRVARGLDDTGGFVLEVVMVTTAAVAIVGFTIWFLVFSGTSPIPLNLSY